MKDEALKLALEALENGKRVRNAEGGTKYQPDLEDNAITAIKQALAAQQEHEPENEPFVSLASVQEPVPVFELQKSGWEIICDLDWIQTLPFGTKLYTTPPAAPKVVDCHATGVCVQSGLRAEKPAPVPTSWMEMVTANLVREGVNKHKARELAEHFYSLAPAAQPAPTVQEPVALEEYDAGLLNDYGGGNVEWWQDYIRAELGRAYEHYQSQIATPTAQPAVPDALTSADIQEHIEYVAGWNDCRQAMLEMMK